MTSSVAPLLATICLTVLVLAASGVLGMHLLPPWLEAPLMKLRHQQSFQGGEKFAGPEGVLMQQLKNVDVSHEPEKVHALNSAIGNLLRNSGAQSERVVRHFEAARDAATRGSDPDTLMSAHLNLAEAYVEQGRPSDSQHELAVATGIMPNHFAEHVFKLNRGRGLVKFELGHTVRALSYFDQAARGAVKPEDVVRIACDSAMATTCLGHPSKSLEPLRGALQVLQAARKEGVESGLPVALHTSLSAEVHFRLAEAFHSLASETSDDADMISNSEFAEAHYKKALHLRQKSSSFKPLQDLAIKKGLARLSQSLTQDLRGVLKPSLRCPSSPRAPWEKVEPINVEDPSFITKITDLWGEQKYDSAASELKAALKSHPRPYRSLQDAAALNMLGETYRMQRDFSESAKYFRQALRAVIACGGESGDEDSQAVKAYEGLRDIKNELSLTDQRVATAALHQYRDSAANHGILVNDPKEKEDPMPPSDRAMFLARVRSVF